MTLKIHQDGFVEIKSKKAALEALQAFRDLKAEIDEVKKESGLDELERDAMAYKAAAQNYMIDKDVEQLQGDGWHATLVKGHGSSRWIVDHGDLTGDEPDRVVPLRDIIEEKFGSSVKAKGAARRMWMRITKRVADVEGIEEVVNAGDLDVDEISPAFIETPRAPYVRIFEDE